MTELDRDLIGRFARLMGLFHRHHHRLRARGPMGDPHRGQGRVLAILEMKSEISQKELSCLLDMRPQSLGELLAKLERAGYIVRSTSEADRRGQDIRLTEAGAAEAARAGAEEDADTLFSCLDAEERGRLRDYLDRVAAALEKRLGGSPDRDEDFGPHGFGPEGRGDGHCGGCRRGPGFGLGPDRHHDHGCGHGEERGPGGRCRHPGGHGRDFRRGPGRERDERFPGEPHPHSHSPHGRGGDGEEDHAVFGAGPIDPRDRQGGRPDCGNFRRDDPREERRKALEEDNRPPTLP